MKSVPPGIANTLWQVTSTPDWYRFHHGLDRLEQIQQFILNRYLKTNQETRFGRQYHFDSIHSIQDYQDRVPLTTYEDYTQYIEAIAAGQPQVLTAEPVLMFEITSGSTSASKLIPYTQTLKSEFQRGIAVWIVDLFRSMKKLKNGPAYWSITPLVEGKKYTQAGIPIGFEEDSAYLGRMGSYLVNGVMAVPNLVKHITDIDAFRYTTLLYLLRQQDLRLISIWNPTYLTLLLGYLPEYWESLLEDIAGGCLSAPGAIEPGIKQALLGGLPPGPARLKALSALSPEDYQGIWPELSLISCWMEATSGSYAHHLQSLFPGVQFQGKGLIATEAFVSIPVCGVEGNPLAYTSHFFEFLPSDPYTLSPTASQPRLAHQLEKGQVYAVIITTGGGLYRYQMHDVVQVLGHLGQIPCLRFLGKSDQVSDWFGEKLNQHFVSAILADLMREDHLTPSFAMLAPNDQGSQFCYTLYLELPASQRQAEILSGLTTQLDRELRQNFHYDYCRKLGQVGAPDLFIIEENASQAYLQACKDQGQRLGNIKPAALHKEAGWESVFSGAFV